MSRKLNLTLPQRAHHRWGIADFFDNRRKANLVSVAEIKSSDVFYDLGCGDASLLIYLVQKCHLQRAIGFETMKSRILKAEKKILQAGLDGRIELREDMYDADLSEADVIFDMMPEGKDDYRLLYSKSRRIRDGTKLIKHDLPLVGFLPNKIVLPFYLMRFPLRRANTEDDWARVVLSEADATVGQLWKELYYYGYEKAYTKEDILRFQTMLSRRVSR